MTTDNGNKEAKTIYNSDGVLKGEVIDEITPEYKRVKAIFDSYNWELSSIYPKIKKLTTWRKIKITINTGEVPPVWAKYYASFAGSGYYNIKYSEIPILQTMNTSDFIQWDKLDRDEQDILIDRIIEIIETSSHLYSRYFLRNTLFPKLPESSQQTENQ